MPDPMEVDINGRGRTLVWDTGHRPDTPTLFLLHGWNVDSSLNFGNAIEPLGREFRVVAADLHGHGSGHRCATPFTIADCANDVVALADMLGIDRFIPVGYSLGGAVAQVLAIQSPHRIDGLVLMATSASFRLTRGERVQFAALNRVAGFARSASRVTPDAAQQALFRLIVTAATRRRYPEWVGDVVLAADMVRLLEAGAELGRFDSTEWLQAINVPTVVVATTADRVVDPSRQRDLAHRLPNSSMVEIDADHRLPLAFGDRYGDVLLHAARQVTRDPNSWSLH